MRIRFFPAAVRPVDNMGKVDQGPVKKYIEHLIIFYGACLDVDATYRKSFDFCADGLPGHGDKVAHV